MTATGAPEARNTNCCQQQYGSHSKWKNGTVLKSRGILPEILENQDILILEKWKKYWKSHGYLSAEKVKKKKTHRNKVPYFK